VNNVVNYVQTKRSYHLKKIEVKPMEYCNINYINLIFTTFLGLNIVICLGCQWRDRKLSDFIKKNLHLFSKDEQKSYGSETR